MEYAILVLWIEQHTTPSFYCAHNYGVYTYSYSVRYGRSSSRRVLSISVHTMMTRVSVDSHYRVTNRYPRLTLNVVIIRDQFRLHHLFTHFEILKDELINVVPVNVIQVSSSFRLGSSTHSKIQFADHIESL